MKRLILAAMLIGCWTAASAAQPDSADDLRQISEIFERWQNAWNTYDMRAFAQLFHDDATWVVWTGHVWRGRQAIEDGHVEVIGPSSGTAPKCRILRRSGR